MSSENPKRQFFLHRVALRLTTYQTIDKFGVHGNNVDKTAKNDLPWSGNGYKKAFVAEMA